ncbi:hypothetical protein BJ912DRAFT_1099096 [Pholiota molesta]|nr:hypothetical protein BJ912DRAFT_1099096 [Pholiota molesta]
MNGLSVRRKPQIARAYAAFFVAASFFIEGTMASQNAHIVRQASPLSPGPENFFSFTSSVAFYATNVDVTQGPPPSSTTSSTRTTPYDGGNVARAVPTGVNNPTQLQHGNNPNRIATNIHWNINDLTPTPTIASPLVGIYIINSYPPDRGCYIGVVVLVAAALPLGFGSTDTTKTKGGAPVLRTFPVDGTDWVN